MAKWKRDDKLYCLVDDGRDVAWIFDGDTGSKNQPRWCGQLAKEFGGKRFTGWKLRDAKQSAERLYERAQDAA